MSKFVQLFFVIALALIVEGCTTGQSNRYPRYPNYPQYPGYPYPDARRGPGQIRDLANRLEEATSDLEEKATGLTPALDNDTLNKIEALHNEAEDFEQEVSDPYGDPRRTDNDFQDLLRKFQDTREVVRKASQQEQLQKDFEQVTGIMSQITAFYGYSLEREEEEPVIL
jgi:uncharacterized protein YktA (UPF0223 family)